MNTRNIFFAVKQEFRPRVIRQLTPWKPHPLLKEGRTHFSTDIPISTPNVTVDLHDIPSGGNANVKYEKWIDTGKKRIDNYLLAWGEHIGYLDD